MTRKKRKGPTLEQQLDRPWCYYCERDFDDMMILTSHQKAKHFKCDKCNRRLNTAGGLSVHMNQVHKEPLERVENALPNRTDPNLEIFGTEGIPDEATRDHRQRVIEIYHQDVADRQLQTGNVQPGSKGVPVPKRAKLGGTDDLKEQLRQFQEEQPGANGDYEMQDAGAPNGYPQGYTNGAAPQGFAPNAVSPAQAGGIGQPPRQAHQGPPGTGFSQAHAPPASAAPAQADQAMPDAPTQATEELVKRPKKEKGIKMFYGDNEVSPEEKMSRLGKYAFDPSKHEPEVLGDSTGAVGGASHGYEDSTDSKPA